MRFDSRFWRRCRVTFRWCRITVWLVVLALLCSFAWLNRIGLPDFLKTRLVASFHEHGIDLQFSRMRLRAIHGLVIDNVRIVSTNSVSNPSLAIAEIQLRLDHAALWHRQLQLDALILRNGKLTLPFAPTNVSPRALTVDGINARLQFQTNDTWTLDRFSANFAGANILINAEIQHGSELRNLEIFHVKKNGQPGAWQAKLKKISETLEKIHFVRTPEIELAVTGDAHDLKTFVLRLDARAPATETPWGSAENIVLAAEAKPLHDGWLPQLKLGLSALDTETRWGNLHHGTLALQTEAAPAGKIPPTVFHFQSDAANSRWGSARKINFDAQLSAHSNLPTNADISLAWWTNVQPYKLKWTAKFARLKSKELDANDVAFGGFWDSPGLVLTNLSAGLGGGQLNAQAKLNVATRELTFTNKSDFDIHAIAAILTPKTRERLAEFAWSQPPILSATGSLILPAWTNRHPDWREKVQPTIHLNGELTLTNATVLGTKIDSAHTHFAYSNLAWNLPNLKLAQGKTKLNLSGGENDGTKDYHWRIRGFFDPESARPFLTESNAARGFSHLTFHKPIALDVTVRGRLYDYADISANGEIAATNFAVRGQPVDSVTGKLFYTNRVLEFLNPVLLRANGAETMTADKVTLDFNRRLVFFTNGFSTAEPQVVGQAIGSKTAKIMSPYHFLTPPTALVHGQLPLHDMKGGHDLDEVDMTFDIIKGAPFRWSKLYATNITGTIHWFGQWLALTNIEAQLYDGSGTGFANFDFRPVEHDCDYDFGFTLNNVNLHLLAENLSLKTNHLEGRLDAHVIVTNASSDNWHSWNGGGSAKLRDGLLWDIPLFSILSPALNAVSPGLGSSRATEAAGKFIITNGVIYTDSLNIGLTLSRLQYVGTVDLKQNVDARVTAQPLRNTWVVGPLISTVLWPVSKLFEYHVTGTLQDPNTTPVYAPMKVLTIPLHPIRSLEGFFPTNSSSYFTNSPPAQK